MLESQIPLKQMVNLWEAHGETIMDSNSFLQLLSTNTNRSQGNSRLVRLTSRLDMVFKQIIHWHIHEHLDRPATINRTQLCYLQRNHGRLIISLLLELQIALNEVVLYEIDFCFVRQLFTVMMVLKKNNFTTK